MAGKIPGLALLIETASEDLLFDVFRISRRRAPTLSPHFSGWRNNRAHSRGESAMILAFRLQTALAP
jgi:hypothetical protein